MLCSYCESGTLLPRTTTESLLYKGGTLHVEGYVYSECDTCHQEIITAEQMKVDQLLIADAKRRFDHFLTSAKIRELRAKYGLSQADAGKVFGGGPNAFYKYENGETIQSQAVDRLMVLARDDVNTYQRLRTLAGLPAQSSPLETASVARVVAITAHNEGMVRFIDVGHPPDSAEGYVQQFLASVSNKTKPLIDNVQIPNDWVH